MIFVATFGFRNSDISRFQDENQSHGTNNVGEVSGCESSRVSTLTDAFKFETQGQGPYLGAERR